VLSAGRDKPPQLRTTRHRPPWRDGARRSGNDGRRNRAVGVAANLSALCKRHSLLCSSFRCCGSAAAGVEPKAQVTISESCGGEVATAMARSRARSSGSPAPSRGIRTGLLGVEARRWARAGRDVDGDPDRNKAAYRPPEGQVERAAAACRHGEPWPQQQAVWREISAMSTGAA
jgi:hypothetical protein